MTEERLLELWAPFEDVLALQLLRRGKEITLLSRIAPVPRAAGVFLEHMSRSHEPLVREAAAALAGLLAESAPLDVLHRLFLREASTTFDEPMSALNAQEVVRAIVFAAARWCRSDRARDAGIELCREIVQRTIDGGANEHWAASPYAMVTLMRHRPEAHRALLERFAAWANGEPPAYVVPTSLQSERGCARALLAGNENALARVEAMLDEKDAAGMVELPERMRGALEELLAATAEWG